MRAAVLRAFGSPLSVETVADPVLGTGEVIVDVAAAGVLPYANEVFSGERGYLLELPIVPGSGGVGRLSAVGPDATRLSVGDWVYIDSTVRSRDAALTPDITLLGLSARGEGGMRLQRHFHNGTYAERVLVPTENVVPLGPLDPSQAARWCGLGVPLVAYGGLLAAGFQAGETLLVSGATGNFGGAAVAVGLAMGAGCVVAPGRNQTVLDGLARRFGPRVRTVHLTGDEDTDRDRMRGAPDGPVDCVVDLLPPSAGTLPVRAAVMTLREFGRAVLMGGVGAELALPYPWLMRQGITVRGSWMYPRAAVAGLVALVNAGLLDLDRRTTAFGLDEVNEAVGHAAAHPGSSHRTVVVP